MEKTGCVTTQKVEWSHDSFQITYVCACENKVHIKVHRNGQVEKSGEAPQVNVTWDDGKCDIEMICGCTAGCHYTRDGATRSSSFRIIN